MIRVLVLLAVIFASLGVNAENFGTGHITGITFNEDGDKGVISIGNAKYAFDDTTKVFVGSARQTLARLREGYEVRYSLSYPLGTAVFVNSIEIVGPGEVVDALLKQ